MKNRYRRPSLHLRVFSLAALATSIGCTSDTVIGKLNADASLLDAGLGAPIDAMVASSGDACVESDCRLEAGRCEAAPITLKRQRLAIYLVLDDGSALLGAWQSLLAAVDQLLYSDKSLGIAMGLQLFEAACDPAGHTAPWVAIDTLPSNAAALRSAIPQHPTKTGEALVPTVQSALATARTWAAANTDTKVIALFVTDANTVPCDGARELPKALSAARDALLAESPVQTFAVGIGLADALADIARAGGTNALSLPIVATAEMFGGAFLGIRDQAMPCAFAAQANATLGVESTITRSASNQAARTFALETSRLSCSAEGEGFYVEDELAKFPIVACPTTCAALQANTIVSLRSKCDTSN